MVETSNNRVWFFTDEPRSKWMDTTMIPSITNSDNLYNDSCVICLAHFKPDRNDMELTWVMNEKAEQLGSLPPSEIDGRLKREGHRTHIGRLLSSIHGTNIRRYIVTVFDLMALYATRIYSTKNSDQLHSQKLPREIVDDRIFKILAKASVHAIYVLGLDFGRVVVDLDERGRTTIVLIHSDLSPNTSEEETILSEEVTRFATEWKQEATNGVTVMLGADPEFVLLSPEGKVVPASRYFPREGATGCDSIVIRGIRHWPLVELRPSPEQEPAALAVQVRRLLASASRRTAGAPLTWRAGAWPIRGLPLGGHVHLSGAALTSERLRALDNAVALPLRLLEPPTAASRRPRYGSLGDFRRQSHGGFEYRTPPSWLVSQRLCCGVLALSKLATEHSRTLASHRPLDDDKMREAFYSGDRTVLVEGGNNRTSTADHLKQLSQIRISYRTIV
ncbi:MAG: hypothetical protein P0Y55_07055 [Candidatus Cohnella colombiensis]|uniref:Uncharacterized protein n=1 Tax=Candidatus Cohnella colombiensis TaxID=3121368 RepID=A0AA95F180_9BACL|nr:MAG: hypothetical protein P0Y55_07055 [Cohnella sp.]